MLMTVLLVVFFTISLIGVGIFVSACIAASRVDRNLYSSRRPIRQEASAPDMSSGFNCFGTAVLTVIPCLMLVASLVLRVSASSLPGDLMYPIKRGGEEVKSVLVSYFGDPVDWHMSL